MEFLVVRDVGTGAEEALLFTTPQSDSDRAARLHVDRLQDAHGFHHDGRAGRVIRRTTAHVPRVEVRTEHDILVGFVRARDLGERVVLVQVVFVELILDHDL